MSRSIKKGPFAAPELLKRVDELNKAGEKKVLKTWSRSSTIFPSGSHASCSSFASAAVICKEISSFIWYSGFPPVTVNFASARQLSSNFSWAYPVYSVSQAGLSPTYGAAPPVR